MFSDFQNSAIRKAQKITKQYKKCLIIFASAVFQNSGGHKIAVASIS